MSSIIRVSFFYLICIINVTNALSQDKIRKLPSNINRPSINLYAPFISGDGKTILYLSDYTDDGHHGMRWATKKTVSTWNDELEVNKLINRPTLNYRGGYSLSFDGNLMLFTSRKSGLGGFDLWSSNRRGNDWEAPSNLGSPVNSRENEGAGMLSPDGEYLYFMRCEKMSEYGGASGCRLMISKRTYNGWDTPVELPSNINTGNSQTPRILADGETLIFASDKFGGKGGLDLYMTTKSGDTWSDPIPLDFINTENHDQFISIPAKGRYLFADVQGDKDRELVQILIPDEFQPKRVMRIQGTVMDAASGDPLNANLTVFNVGVRDRLWNEQVGKKGEFAIVLKEGAVYDVAVDMDDPTYLYFSKVYDLSEGVGTRDKESLQVKLTKIESGMTYNPDIFFEEHSSNISDNSTFELRRIAEVLRKNPSMAIEILVSQNNFRKDSIQSDDDLTEIDLDTLIVEVKKQVLQDVVESKVEEDSSRYEENKREQDEIANDQDDGQMEYKVVEETQIKKHYHNDRTQNQATAIKAYLVGRGVAEDRILLRTSRKEKAADTESDVDLPDVKVEVKILKI
ncbi:PD40 domain-containing protein [Fulvivirga sp. 29W222]|uniref:PD40 domain-containing protein n=1 Tax=Fulvivirga marina TaxID=2494733 RepID=A0A937FXN4_9BACT|nr:PD40 domain-containing protein [Fulvivirga marina]MBL6446280.1 PD40 domain-containing protein [Fulvivirga marina]